MLFLRPIIPRVANKEINEILRRAMEAGAVGVVFGSLRVSQKILARLEEAGLNVKPILQEKDASVAGNKLVTVPMPGFKGRAVQTAKEEGLIAFLSACCANAYTAAVPCMSLCWTTRLCTQCPNNCAQKIPEITEEEVTRAVNFLFGLEPKRVQLDNLKIAMYFPDSPKMRKVRQYSNMLQIVARRRIKIIKSLSASLETRIQCILNGVLYPFATNPS